MIVFCKAAHGIQRPLDRVWAQDGAGGWVDATAASGLGDLGNTRSAVARDLDRDGCLDLVTYRLMGGPRVYQGNCGDDAAVVVQAGGLKMHANALSVEAVSYRKIWIR